LFGDDAEKLANRQEGGRQNAVQSLLPLAQRHLIDRNVGGDPRSGIGDESVDPTEPLDCLGEQALT
jgi:hypothetical protein